jgi:hypothetical protein
MIRFKSFVSASSRVDEVAHMALALRIGIRGHGPSVLYFDKPGKSLRKSGVSRPTIYKRQFIAKGKLHSCENLIETFKESVLTLQEGRNDSVTIERAVPIHRGFWAELKIKDEPNGPSTSRLVVMRNGYLRVLRKKTEKAYWFEGSDAVGPKYIRRVDQIALPRKLPSKFDLLPPDTKSWLEMHQNIDDRVGVFLKNQRAGH